MLFITMFRTSGSDAEVVPIPVEQVQTVVVPISLPIFLPVEEAEQQTIDLGEFKITAYCPCVKCCGKSDGITSTGVIAQANRTIAVDPKIIPYGSKIIIDGDEYVAEDCGGAIKCNKIDIFFDTHDEALQFGVQHKNVQMLVG